MWDMYDNPQWLHRVPKLLSDAVRSVDCARR
jgi:hypothetical protein